MADALPAGATPVEPIAAAEIRPRFELYVTGEDHLRIMAVNSLAGVVLTIAGRAWDPVAGVIVPIERKLAPPADRTAAELIIPLAAGFLLDLTVFASSASPLSGQTYVMAQLVRGLTSNAPQLATLTADYVTSLQCLCWPGSAPKSSTEGEPYVRLVLGTNPAPGLECSETVPTGARWELLSFYVTLQTSAPGGSRVGCLAFATGAGVYAQFPSVTNIAPATSKSITWAKGLPQGAVSTGSRPSGGLGTQPILLAGHMIQTILDGGDPGDDYGAPLLSVREWLEVP